jgi:hypothetical protein
MFYTCACIMMTTICTPRQVAWITPVIRARMWYEACDTNDAEEGLREKPEGRSPLQNLGRDGG